MNDLISIVEQKPNVVHGTGASDEEIAEAEEKLGCVFSQDYAEYLRAYGVAEIDGHELTGICGIQRLDVAEMTSLEREANPETDKDCYLIEKTGVDGINVWQYESGRISVRDWKFTEIQSFEDLGDYLMSF